jgi:hypothetical protein
MVRHISRRRTGQTGQEAGQVEVRSSQKTDNLAEARLQVQLGPEVGAVLSLSINDRETLEISHHQQSITALTLHRKMLHKTQSHCSPNLIFADVLNNSYTHTIYTKKIKYCILKNTRSKVKFEDLGNVTAEYIGVTGHWKGQFIDFEKSIK